MASKLEKSIHIGINYAGTKSELNGCVSDAVNLLELSTKLGIDNITLLVDIDINNDSILKSKTVTSSRNVLLDNVDNIKLGNPTKQNILNEIFNTVSDSKIGSLFLTYSGHGAKGKESFFNSEETDNRDEYICTLGNTGKYEGDYASFISDDELFDTINKSSILRDTPLVITYVFDCCHSGTVFDLPHTLNKINNKITFSTQPTLNKKNLNSIVTMSGWSGCQDIQYSYENFNNLNRMVEGVCTRGFCRAVNELVLDNTNNTDVNNFDLHISVNDYMSSIDSFKDSDVDMSENYQVLNHSSSLNIGLTDNYKIMTQKFVLGRANNFTSLKSTDITLYVTCENYAYLDIKDSDIEHIEVKSDEESEDDESDEVNNEVDPEKPEFNIPEKVKITCNENFCSIL
jgi:hypothetical protein